MLRKNASADAPSDAAGLLSAALEPAVAVATLLAAYAAAGSPVGLPELTLALIVAALGWSGRDRSRESPRRAAAGIVGRWLVMTAVLALFGWSTGATTYFDPGPLIAWIAMTPVAQWLAALAARALRRAAAKARRPRRVVVAGGGLQGARIWAALQAGGEAPVEMLGVFDDRTDDRIEPTLRPHVLGSLRELPAWARRHGVDDVYLTVPGSVERAADLVAALRGADLRILVVPDEGARALLRARQRTVGGLLLLELPPEPDARPGGSTTIATPSTLGPRDPA